MNEPETIFYDGQCGLCHRWVAFVLRRDVDGSKFSFAPVQGEHFAAAVAEAERAALPDSMFVRRADGRLLQKSAGPLHILRRLGGGWWVLGALGWAVPRPLRDVVYTGVAAVRHHFFEKPDAACPLLPPELRSRFRF